MRKIIRDLEIIAKGDKVGHEFHGNQWTNKFQNTDEAKEYLQKKYGIWVQIDKDAKLEGVHETIKAFDKATALYGKPSLLHALAIKNLPENEYANFYWDYGDEGWGRHGELTINTLLVNNEIKKEDSISLNPEGYSKIEAAMMHEYAHAIHADWKEKHEFGDTNLIELTTKARQPYMNATDLDCSKIPELPSVYALTDHMEYVAETYVQAHMTDKPLTPAQKACMLLISNQNPNEEPQKW